MSCELLVTLQGSCIWTAKTGLLVHHIQHLIQFYLHIQSIPISACFAAIVCLKTVKQIFSEPHMQFLVCIDGQGRSQIFELQLHVINGNSRWATKQGVFPHSESNEKPSVGKTMLMKTERIFKVFAGLQPHRHKTFDMFSHWGMAVNDNSRCDKLTNDFYSAFKAKKK